MLEELRQRLRRLEKPPGLEDGPATLPLGVPAVDTVLGGGLLRGALHEIAASSEAHVAAATGFALEVATRAAKSLLWVSEDMVTLESGAPYGPGLDGIGLSPERLVTVSVAQRRDLLWVMEEALRCRAIGCVIGELRHGALDTIAVRRLSLAATETGALALLLRTTPENDASTAATRWMVKASPSSCVSPGRERSERTRNPETNSELASGFRVRGLTAVLRNDQETTARFLAKLVRNRRGARGQWIFEWSDSDGHFTRAAHAQPVAHPPVHRPHRQVA
jgi:protein ImuA